MKFYFTLYLVVCTVIYANANDLTCIAKSTIKGGSTGSIDLSISGGASPYKISWAGPNGFSATTEDLANLAVGTYTVTVTDTYCGTATTAVVITDFLTGIDEMNAALISIFPNPVSTDVEVRLPEFLKNYQLRITNALGELLMEKKNESLSSFTLDLRNMHAGMYLLEIIQDGQLYRKKVMKY